MRRMKMIRWCYCIVFCAWMQTQVFAQEIKVSGGFLSDSVRVGESVGYYLSAAYPKKLTVLFPDSTFAFLPFEFGRKNLSPTHTENGISHDSVVYYLSTFEIDKIQYLSLPVFVTAARDCTAYTPQRDSIFLAEMVLTPPSDSTQAQNLPLKTSTTYQQVFSQFNYILLAVAAGLFILLSVVIWLIFGKRIVKYFKLKKLQKNHLKFLQSFSEHFQQLNTIFSPEKTEAAISLWKKYLEQLEQKPYTKLTTRETLQMEPNETLGINLTIIDRAIYGNQTSVHEPLLELRKFAEERFIKKLEEIKHG